MGPPPPTPGFGGDDAAPAPPVSRGHGGLFVAIVGALVILLAVGAGIFFLTMRNRGADNTAATSQAPVAPATVAVTTPAAAPPTTIAVSPTTAALTVRTPGAPPAATTGSSAAPTANGGTDSWTDPENRVTVRFPAAWQKDTFDTRDENSTLDKAQPLLQLTSPDGVRFSVTIYVSTKTLDQDVQSFRDATTADPKLAVKYDPTQDATVGGERAKFVTGSYMQNGQPVAVAVWFADHGGKRFGLSADHVGTHRGDIDTIVGSTTFVAAGAQVTATPVSGGAPVTRAPTALATTSSLFGTPGAARTPAAASLKVTLKNGSFTLSPTPIQAGSVPIAIENTGTAAYTVEFHGTGVDYVSPAIPPGQTLRVSLTFQAGTYTVICNVPGPMRGTLSAQ